MLREAAVGDDPRIELASFSGLLADFARSREATVVVRGLRAVSDFEYEFQMALMNRRLNPDLETVFLVPALDLTYLSSSLVREVGPIRRQPRRARRPGGGRRAPGAVRQVSFRTTLRARAGGRRARLVFPEAADPRIRAAAEELKRLHIADPILLGVSGPEPAQDPRLRRVAEFLRQRRPQAVKDGRHALDLATDPIRFAAALVALGEADGCVAGAGATTPEVVRAALWAIGPRPEAPRSARRCISDSPTAGC